MLILHSLEHKVRYRMLLSQKERGGATSRLPKYSGMYMPGFILKIRLSVNNELIIFTKTLLLVKS